MEAPRLLHDDPKKETLETISPTPDAPVEKDEDKKESATRKGLRDATTSTREKETAAIEKEENATNDGSGDEMSDEEVMHALYLYAWDPEAANVIIEYSSDKPQTGVSAEPEYVEFPSTGVTVLEFYAPWCPHCQHYKGRFIELAKEVQRRSINTRVNFITVSCVANPLVCQTYNLDGFPTILGFPEGQKSDKNTTGIALNEDKDPDGDFIGEKLGLEMALEVRKVENRDNMFDDAVDMEQWEEEMAVLAVKAAALKRSQHEFERPLDKMYADVGRSLTSLLQNSVYMSAGPLAKDRKNALFDFVDLMTWALPKEWGFRRYGLVEELRKNMDLISKEKNNLMDLTDPKKAVSLGVFDITKATKPKSQFSLHQFSKKDNKPTKPPRFHLHQFNKQCSHNQPGAGYTCGLWELFHILSIGVSENALSGFQTGHIVGARDASETLRNFIHKFFGCDVCRTHFVNMYDACGHDHCARLKSEVVEDGRDFAVWLWEVHNAVNVRLMKEAAERDRRDVTMEESESAKFPTRKMCGRCWKEDGGWDDDSVYSFLKQQYWPNHGEPTINFDKLTPKIEPLDDEIHIAWLLLALAIGIILTFRVVTKRKIARTGRHKKYDDDYLLRSNGHPHVGRIRQL